MQKMHPVPLKGGGLQSLVIEELAIFILTKVIYNL